MQRLEVSGAVRPIYGSLGVKRLKVHQGRGRKIRFYVTTLSDLMKHTDVKQLRVKIIFSCFSEDMPSFDT